MFVYVWVGLGSLLTSSYDAINMFFHAASQDIVLERTQPVDGVPCAGQTVIYNCRVVGSGEQRWSLPNGESQDLRFTAASSNGTVRPSVDGNFIATLTSRTGIDPDFIFDSTLMIKEAMNYSMTLTCTASGGVSDTTMIVVSGEFLQSTTPQCIPLVYNFSL